MESWFCSRWIYLWMVIALFTNISADVASPPRYTISHTGTSFNQAMGACSPGVLTSLATDQEVSDVLELIAKSASALNETEVTFWIGLRKVKNNCVIPSLPLRGFRWVEDDSHEAQVIHWAEEPETTCTAVRCVALKVRSDASAVTWWGLNSVSCRHNTHGYICKFRDRPAGGTHATTPLPVTADPLKPEPRPTTQKPERATAEPKLPTQGLEPETNPGTSSDPASEQVQGPDSCQHPLIPGVRSLSLDPNNSSRIQVECWSTVQLVLLCSGRPAAWRLLDDSAANFTTVCQPCEDGFQKDTFGKCVDVDECGGGGAGPCQHVCLNTEGSYRCACLDEDGKHHDGDSQFCKAMGAEVKSSLSGFLILVVVAVATLVLLVVIIAVIVNCVLMKRSRKHVMDGAEKVPM